MSVVPTCEDCGCRVALHTANGCTGRQHTDWMSNPCTCSKTPEDFEQGVSDPVTLAIVVASLLFVALLFLLLGGLWWEAH